MWVPTAKRKVSLYCVQKEVRKVSLYGVQKAEQSEKTAYENIGRKRESSAALDRNDGVLL